MWKVRPRTKKTRRNKSNYFSVATNSKNQTFRKVGEYKYCLLDSEGVYTNYIKFSNSKEKLLKDFEQVKFGGDFKKNFVVVETEIVKNKEMKNGGEIPKDREVFYKVYNNDIGNIELGFRRLEIDGHVYNGIFLSESDAIKGLFDFIKEGLQYGNYSLAKEYPKSKFSILQVDTSKKPSKDRDVYEKVVYTITAKEVIDLHKINRLEDGGSISSFNYTVGGL
jgi:hypothetical protein